MLFDSYDPFTFIHRNKQNNINNIDTSNTIPITTCVDCIPKPTPLPGNQQFY